MRYPRPVQFHPGHYVAIRNRRWNDRTFYPALFHTGGYFPTSHANVWKAD